MLDVDRTARVVDGEESGAGMARFEVRTSDERDRVVVALFGECDLTVREELTSALLSAIDRSRVVCVDMGALSFMDSSGIHALVKGYHAVQERGQQLHVVNAAGVVKEVLDLTGVADLLRPPSAGSPSGGGAEHV